MYVEMILLFWSSFIVDTSWHAESITANSFLLTLIKMHSFMLTAYFNVFYYWKENFV